MIRNLSRVQRQVIDLMYASEVAVTRSLLHGLEALILLSLFLSIIRAEISKILILRAQTNNSPWILQLATHCHPQQSYLSTLSLSGGSTSKGKYADQSGDKESRQGNS